MGVNVVKLGELCEILDSKQNPYQKKIELLENIHTMVLLAYKIM